MTATDLLNRLIETTEQPLYRPRFLSDIATAETICADVVGFANKPTDGARFIGAEAVTLAGTLIALAAARIGGRSRELLLYAQLAGLILPYIREDLGRAIEAAKRPTA